MQSTISIVLSIAISIIASVVSGAMLFFTKRFFKKKEIIERQRYDDRVRENMLIIRSIDVIGKLTFANSMALRDQRVNETMNNALKEYEEVSTELYNYLVEINARNRKT